MPATATPAKGIATKKFAIRSTRPAEQKEGNKIIFGTGEQVPFDHTCELYVIPYDDDHIEYITGLEPRHIRNSPYYDPEQKEALLKQQADAIKLLGEAFGKDRIKSTNKRFWDERSAFQLNNGTLVSFFDTRETEHLLLYWKIKGGGYSDEIAPTFEVGQQFGVPFYLTEIEEEAERRTEGTQSKVKAFAVLSELNDKSSTEDMFWLSWMLHPVNMGYTKSTPKATLFSAHFDFIEGLLVKKAKKSCAKQFVDAYNLLKNDKTRALATAIVRAGDYLQLVFLDKDNMYSTRRNEVQLGKTIEDAVETLLKPINHEELELLREEVEEKLR